MGPQRIFPITTGGAGYIPENNIDVRKRLYDNVTPFGYNNPVERLFSALFLNKRSKYNEIPHSGNYDALDELWANYLQIPKDQRHYDPVLKKSKYKPTKSNNSNATYYAIPLDDDERQYIVNAARHGKTRNVNPELGAYTISHGEDEYGPYASYYDKWDLNPFRGTTSVGGKVSRFLGLDKIEDLSLGIGKPVEVYDRIYYNQFGQAEPSIQATLPEIVVFGKKRIRPRKNDKK